MCLRYSPNFLSGYLTQEPVNRPLQLQRCPAKMFCDRMQAGMHETRAGGGVPPKGKAIRRPDRRGGVNGVSDWKKTVPKAKLSSIYGLIRIVLFFIGPLKPDVEEKVVEQHLFLSLVHF